MRDYTEEIHNLPGRRFSFGAMANTCKKNWLVILLVTAICGAVTFALTEFIVPEKYQCTITFSVENHSQDVESTFEGGDVTATATLAEAYASILLSRPVLENAASAAGLNYSYEQLQKWVEAGEEGDTQLVNVVLTMDNAKEVYALAQELTVTAPTDLSKSFPNSYARVVVNPYAPDKPVSPSVPRDTLIACILGAFISIVVLTIRDISDKRVRNTGELETLTGIYVLGSVPDSTAALQKRGRNGNTRRRSLR